MSYDFWIEMDAGGDEPLSKSPEFSDTHPLLGDDVHTGNVMVTERGYVRCGNYTSNVGAIWARCLEAAGTEEGARLRDLDGKRCLELAVLLERAVDWGAAHIDELRELNPPNGWGNAEGAVTYLWDIQRLCSKYPKATLRLDY